MSDRWTSARAHVLALAAQALTFTALFLPVLVGMGDALVFFGVCAGLSAIAAKPAVLAYHARTLTLPDDRHRTATRVSVQSLVLVCLTGALLGGALLLGSGRLHDLGRYAAWISFYLFFQGLYLVEVAVITRLSLHNVYAQTRMIYLSLIHI